MIKNFPKSAVLYTINDGFRFDVDGLEPLLSEFAFKPCGLGVSSKMGFVSPLGGKELCHLLPNDGFVLKVKLEEKVIPPAEIKREYAKRLAAIEFEEGRIVRGAERSALKAHVTAELCDKAFSRYKTPLIMALPEQSLLCVFGASPKLADSVTSLLRKALGRLGIQIAETLEPVNLVGLYAGHLSTPLIKVDEKTKLQDLSGSRVSFDNCDFSGEARQILGSGFEMVSLGLTLDGTLSFTLTDKFEIKSLKWDEALVMADIEPDVFAGGDLPEGASEVEPNELARRATLEGDLLLIKGALIGLCSELFPLFGGLHIRKHVNDKAGE